MGKKLQIITVLCGHRKISFEIGLVKINYNYYAHPSEEKLKKKIQ